MLSDVIEIDLENPELNREVMIFSIQDLEHAGNVYNCFTIQMSSDMRDAAAEKISAMIVSDTEILISMPGLPYGIFADSIGRNERLKTQNLHCPKLQLAQDVTINDIREDQTRSVKHLLLRFPSHVVLTNVFNPSSPKLLHDMQTDFTFANLRGRRVPMVVCYMTWRVGNLETHRRAVVQAAPRDAMDVLAEQFASMYPDMK